MKKTQKHLINNILINSFWKKDNKSNPTERYVVIVIDLICRYASKNKPKTAKKHLLRQNHNKFYIV